METDDPKKPTDKLAETLGEMFGKLAVLAILQARTTTDLAKALSKDEQVSPLTRGKSYVGSPRSRPDH